MTMVWTCSKCGRELKDDQIVWLEVNDRTGTYHDPDKQEVPEADSLGLYAFGKTCAKQELKQAKEKDDGLQGMGTTRGRM